MSAIKSIINYPSNHPLAYRVLFAVLLFSSLITLIATAFQLYSNYRKDVGLIDKQIMQIKAGYEQSISLGVWDYDRNQILKLIGGIKKLPSIQYLAIKDLEDKILISLGDDTSDNIMSYTFPLNFVDTYHRVHHVGSFVIKASLHDAFTRLKESVLYVLVAQTIKTFLVSVFILLVIRQLITRHLTTIANYLSRRRFGMASQPLDLPRRRREDVDELDQVVDALNRMGSNLDKHLEERETREAELIKNRNYVTQVINLMPSMIIGIDEDRRITQWNNESVARSGVQSQDVIGHPLSEALPQIAPELAKIIDSMTDEQSANKFKVKVGSGKKTRFSDITIYPLADDTHAGAVIRVDDVTEKTKMEEMMILNEKMISVGLMAASVAHEINNPINSVINLAEIQRKDSKKDSVAHDYSSRILKEGLRIAEIVKSLLSFSHSSGSQKSLIHCKTIVEETLILVRTQLKRDGIHIGINIPDDLPTIKCNKSQLQQIILNIITNAQYALNQKFPSEDDEKTLIISGEISDQDACDQVRLIFYDSGIGIREELIEDVLEPFFSTKPVGAGTGLGLSISNEIIANHDGQIHIESVEGLFTKVIVTIPISKQK